MRKILYLLTILIAQHFLSQEKEKEESPKINLSGFVEVFYTYDFNEPNYHNHLRQPFLYTYNRHNEFNLDLAVLKANYQTENVRANLALQLGTYATDNLNSEKDVFKFINEANLGVRLSKKHNIWLDAGIMPTHIGWESVFGKDDATLTRNIGTENQPFYETGVKVSYTTQDGVWQISGSILNGWQRISRVDGNQTMAFGSQLSYKPNDKFLFNSSTFIGNDKPEEEKKMRYFHDFFMVYSINEKIQTTFAFDIGAEQKEKGSKQYNIWYSPNFLLKYQFTPKFSTTGRVEFYSDRNNVLSTPENKKPFQ